VWGYNVERRTQWWRAYMRQSLRYSLGACLGGGGGEWSMWGVGNELMRVGVKWGLVHLYAFYNHTYTYERCFRNVFALFWHFTQFLSTHTAPQIKPA
jgi:hypothetical protein